MTTHPAKVNGSGVGIVGLLEAGIEESQSNGSHWKPVVFYKRLPLIVSTDCKEAERMEGKAITSLEKKLKADPNSDASSRLTQPQTYKECRQAEGAGVLVDKSLTRSHGKPFSPTTSTNSHLPLSYPKTTADNKTTHETASMSTRTSTLTGTGGNG